MKFEEVLPALRKGKKVGRKKWDKSYYVNNYGEAYVDWEDLLATDWEIVKETKKVKLRDLTEEQYREYDCEERICAECPFSKVECNLKYDNCWIKHKELYSNKFLDQEIEIEEE